MRKMSYPEGGLRDMRNMSYPQGGLQDMRKMSYPEGGLRDMRKMSYPEGAHNGQNIDANHGSNMPLGRWPGDFYYSLTSLME